MKSGRRKHLRFAIAMGSAVFVDKAVGGALACAVLRPRGLHGAQNHNKKIIRRKHWTSACREAGRE